MNNLTLTNHAKLRMQQRIITLQDIYNCVKFGASELQKEGKTKYTYQNIYVILNPTTNTVITACFTKSYTKQLERHAKLNNIGFYAAVRQLRRESIVS